MPVVDPRERYDDLVLDTDREVLSHGAFEDAARSETAASGWVAVGCVLDAADRLLLVDQPWAAGWVAPGGAVEPGESLPAAVAREVREETGIECTPARPHGLRSVTTVDEETGDSFEWRVAFFAADADTTAIGDDLGVGDEQVFDARWFAGLPDRVFDREMIERVYRRSIE